jgi:hypothetical protein
MEKGTMPTGKIETVKKNEPEFTPEQQFVLDETPKLMSEIQSMVDGGAVEKLSPAKFEQFKGFLSRNKTLIIGITVAVVGAVMGAEAQINHSWDIQNMDIYMSKAAVQEILGGLMVIFGGASAISHKAEGPKYSSPE